MQVGKISENNFSGFLNSKMLLKTTEFAADNGALFAAGTSLILSTFVRPLAILATPNAQKENKEYACAKSIASSLVGFGVMALISNPIIKAVNNIEKNPAKFLNRETVDVLKNGSSALSNAPNFKFCSQMFKLGSGFVSILPKAILTALLIPPVMKLFFNKPEYSKNNNPVHRSGNLSFGSKIPGKTVYTSFTEKISKVFGDLLNKPAAQEFAKKYNTSNFPQHVFSANDVLATALFAKCVSDSKKIDKDRKKTLIYNASFMTGFTVAGGYLVNSILKKPTEIFIQKFKEANKFSPKLDKYIEGIKIAKPALILGVMYYLIAPVISTMLAEIFTDRGKNE